MQYTAHNENQVSNVLHEHDVAVHEGCGSRDRNDYQRFLSECGITALTTERTDILKLESAMSEMD